MKVKIIKLNGNKISQFILHLHAGTAINFLWWLFQFLFFIGKTHAVNGSQIMIN